MVPMAADASPPGSADSSRKCVYVVMACIVMAYKVIAIYLWPPGSANSSSKCVYVVMVMAFKIMAHILMAAGIVRLICNYGLYSYGL